MARNADKPPVWTETDAPARVRPCGENQRKVSVESGIATIREAVKTLPEAPGVYRMLAEDGEALYVGKARNLKRRVGQYAQVSKLAGRQQRMVSETRSMEFIRTHTEVEALLLESNLIKRLRPRFNVLLRDDKSFPFIVITGDHPYPQLTKHRGASRASDGARPGRYFGPFASAGAVNRTIAALQRAFMLRNCTDSMFASRTRPCLQYQIKRCTAPCVGRVSQDEYATQVEEARAFLSGQSRAVQERFATAMQHASEALDFETAAQYRDRIRALSAIQAHQDINVSGIEDADIFAIHSQGGQSCVQVFFFRGGQNYGNRAYFPAHDRQESTANVLAAFVAQFYDNKLPPASVLLSQAIDEADLLQDALSEKAGRKVVVHAPQRGEKRRLIEHCSRNAKEALARRQSESASQAKLLGQLAEAFGLEAAPQRIEVYDNSHVSGSHPVGAMIVAGPDGFEKAHYRKFTIKSAVEPGDDYAMMREVLTRRFSRAQKEDPERSQGQWPDLVLIDGGKGQLGVALGVLEELGIQDLPVVGVAKGPDRHAGRERFFMPDAHEPVTLHQNDPVLYYVQRLRDEAHRFAIGTHRAKRSKALSSNPLDDVPGIGPKRRRALLHHFGSGRAVKRAGLTDLEAVDGISKAVAKKIYEHFHGDA